MRKDGNSNSQVLGALGRHHTARREFQRKRNHATQEFSRSAVLIIIPAFHLLSFNIELRLLCLYPQILLLRRKRRVPIASTQTGTVRENTPTLEPSFSCPRETLRRKTKTPTPTPAGYCKALPAKQTRSYLGQDKRPAWAYRKTTSRSTSASNPSQGGLALYTRTRSTHAVAKFPMTGTHYPKTTAQTTTYARPTVRDNQFT